MLIGRQLRVPCALLLAAWCTAVRAEAVVSSDVSAGALAQGTFWFAGAAWHPLVEAAWRGSLTRPDAVPLSIVAGLRAAPGARLPVPVEGFARADFIGRVSAVSEPTFGIELAVTGIARPDSPGKGFPAGVSALEAAHTSPVCLSVVVAPLRLHFGRLHLTAAEIHVGVTVGGGDVVVFRAGLFRLELGL